MTSFFEVTKRDGSGRVGLLRLSSDLKTPLIIDSEKIGKSKSDYFVSDGGSLWLSQNIYDSAKSRINTFKESSDFGKNLYILPRLSFTQQYPSDSYFKYAIKINDVYNESGIFGNSPTCAVIHPTGFNSFSKHEGADVYIFESVSSFENDPVRFYNEFQKLRLSIPFDSALWIPNFATPENVALLIYMGADIFDTTCAIVSAGFDKYMTNAGIYNLNSLKTLPCSCKECSSNSIEEVLNFDKEKRFNFLKNHNISALESELRLATQKLHDGTLREYVEGQCRVQPWLAGLLRLYDSDSNNLSVSPAFRTSIISATTGDSLNRSEIRIFADKIKNSYVPPEKDILVIFPCSAKKPYSLSNSHRNFIWAMGRNRAYVNEIIITSPIGLIPRELEITYPAAHYDTTVTGHWDNDERHFVGSLLENYLIKNKYKYIIAHVSGPYKEICEQISSKLKIPFEFTSESSPSSRESCNNLKAALDRIVRENKEKENKKENKEKDNKKENKDSKNSENPLKRRSFELGKVDQCIAILRHQFGEISSVLYSGDFSVRANFPKYQLYSENVQIATLVPKYGLFSLTAAGAEKILKSPDYKGQHTVFIDKFVPRGSLLAPGVIDADKEIRPGDEVIISGELAYGVGKAFMSGREMIDSGRGIAVFLRHIKEKNKKES